jgi:NTP pyrophosphatase (non-canonical NTP hydrolase)
VNLNELELAIEKWGIDKGIIPDVNPLAQFDKTVEEVRELIDAILEHNHAEIKDAIGDIFVTLVMQTRAWNLTMEECVSAAYEVISKRKGKMVDGQFVKEAE